MNYLKNAYDLHVHSAPDVLPRLMNDIENHVKLIVDRDILKEKYFACHPCINTSSLRLKTEDVLGRFLRAVDHDYLIVTL